jgi:outer membrane lipopolysaccharide assembly protein LptE/RlpB
MKKLRYLAMALICVLATGLSACGFLFGNDDIVVDPQNLEFAFNGGTLTVTVESEQTWEATSNAPEWLTVTKTGKTTISVTALPNEGSERTAVITVDNRHDTQTINVIQEEVFGDSYLRASGDYYGAGFYPAPGKADFFVWLIACETNAIGVPTGPGYIVKLYLCSETPVDKPRLDLAPGTYTVTNDAAMMTIDSRFSGLDTIDENLVRRYLYLESGTLTVEGDNRNYTMKLDINLTNGDHYTGSYVGPMVVLNPDYLTSLEDDLDMGTVPAEGTLRFAGDYFGAGSYIWLLSMGSEGIYVGDDGNYHGEGLVFQAQIASEIAGDGAWLPDYRYVIAETDREPGTALLGRISPSTYQPAGAWVFIYENDAVSTRAPFVEGTITSTRSGNNYSFEIDCVDDYGNVITGTFTATLPVTPYAVPVSPVNQRWNNSTWKRSSAISLESNDNV